MARVKVQITTPSNNVIKVSPGVSALSSVQLYLNELIDVNSAHGAEGYVLTQQADGTFAMEAVATTLSDLSDTNILNPQGGDSLVYDAGSQKWVPGGVKSVNGQDGDVVITIPSPPPTPGVSGLADTNITNLQDNQIIRYDSNSGNWLNEDLEALPAGGTTGQALVKATGTDYDVEWADIAIDTQYHNRFQTDAETFRSGATDTVELYYTAKADGDGLAESASSDTPTAGKIIRRKIYYSEAAFADPDTGTWVEFTPAPADDASFATVKAALLEYLKARTGGTVPISLKQTWEEVDEAPAFTGLLNETYGSGAAAAYGTRRLNGNYSGACMTIRRASDGTTQTIGFVGEEIDESAITTFCTGSTCTVQVWHDQSQTGGTGSGNDATQTTPANQPTIYTGGQLVKEGGRLALDFDGTNDGLTNTDLTTNSDETFAIVANYNNASSSGTLFDSAQTDEHTAFVIQSEFRAKFGSNTDMKYGDAATGQKLHWIYKDNTTSSSSYGAIDGGATDALNAGTNNANGIMLGNNRVSSFPLNGQIQELVLFGENKTANRTDIEGNISAYYQSAKLLDEQYGSGAEAAYSVRQLKRDNTECMVIRRASDSTTTTIGFDSEGNIDEAAITTFCTGTTCTVESWLDQSGNGNTATAAAPTNEPTIYTGGALVKENGKLALDFDGTGDFLQKASPTGFSGKSQSSFNIVANDSVTIDAKFFYSLGDVTVSTGQLRSITQEPYLRFQATTQDYNSYHTSGNQELYSLVCPSATTINDYDLYRDGSLLTPDSLSGGTIADINASFLTIGFLQGASTANTFNGKQQELILYNSDKSSDRTSIESNIGNYFTQNTPLLDTYTGAAAAYSLRRLSSSYVGSAVEVYNGSSYADIGFDVFGELDTVALAAHCGTNNGFVSKWYDQAGSNDATQGLTANMPKIYDGATGVVTENGKPIMIDPEIEMFTATFTGGSSATICGVLTGSNGYQDIFLRSGSNYYFRTQSDVTTAGSYVNGIGTVTTYANSNLQGNLSRKQAGDLIENTQTNLFATCDLSSFTDLVMGNGSRGGMNMQEVIIWNSNQDSAGNRAGIETNINTFYNIY